MSIQNTRYTPARRGPSLADGTGGASERPQARERDRVLRVVGHRTEDIRLTPTGVDADGGDGALYNMGAPDQLSVGRYLITQQGAASATAEPLGTILYMEVEIREQTAGVFNVSEVQHFAGDQATPEATLQDMASAVLADRATDDDALDFSGSASADGLQMACFIVTSTQATDLAAAGLAQGVVPAAGDMVIYDTQAASTRVYAITRLS